MGSTLVRQQPVAKEILGKMIYTIRLTLIAQIITIIVAIIFGAITAVKQYSLLDNVFTILAMFGWSMPSFWLALMLVFAFSLGLGWFPSSGVQTLGVTLSPMASFFDQIKHMILPIMVYSIGYIAYLFRLVRSSMLEVLNQDYIVAARAKGVKELVVIYKHALRNALLPVVTYVGLSFGFLIGGSAITETIFAWPGLGKYAVWAAMHKDFQAILGTTMTFAVVILLANLITDIAYALLDPRIRY
jgi:peptide/nickel transport system permease protein